MKLSLLKSGAEPEHQQKHKQWRDTESRDQHVTVDLEGVNSLELSGWSLTESREHVDEVIEAQVPLSVLRERLHDSVSEWVLLSGDINVGAFIGSVQSLRSQSLNNLNQHGDQYKDFLRKGTEKL